MARLLVTRLLAVSVWVGVANRGGSGVCLVGVGVGGRRVSLGRLLALGAVELFAGRASFPRLVLVVAIGLGLRQKGLGTALLRCACLPHSSVGAGATKGLRRRCGRHHVGFGCRKR